MNKETQTVEDGVGVELSNYIRENLYEHMGRVLVDNLMWLIDNKIQQELEEVKREERERIAKIVGRAGDNSISTLRTKDFTGTYWISANNLYKELTGFHLNKAREIGSVVNSTFNEIDEEALTPKDLTDKE